MSLLHIRLFGGLEVRHGPTVLPPMPGHGPRSLLAFLALEPGRLHHRDVLCGMLWGDRSDGAARKALRNSLWRLRTALEPEEDGGRPVFQAVGDRLGLVADGLRVDVHEFEEATASLADSSHARQAPDQEEAERLDRAVALYRGDLLDGVYEDWCLVPRERLRMAFLSSLERLMAYHRRCGDLAAGLARGRALLRHDPLREHVHRALMEIHWTMGDRPSALRQFRECREILMEELGIEPMEETAALRDRILRGARADGPFGRRPRASLPAGVEDSVEEALRVLTAVADRLEELRAVHREASVE